MATPTRLECLTDAAAALLDAVIRIESDKLAAARTRNPTNPWDLPERWTDKVSVTAACWLWTGALNSKGYASVADGHGKSALAHRLSYEHFIGPIPRGLTIDHTCGITRCVNPAHLEAVTNDENTRRRYAQQTVCTQGHPLTPENVRVHTRRNGHTSKDCKRCAAETSRRYRERLKEAS